MTPLHSTAADQLAQFVGGSPPEAVEALAAGLEGGAITLTSPSLAIRELPRVSEDRAVQAATVFRNLPTRLDAAAVGALLRVGNAVRGLERRLRADIEIVWTGPGSEGPLVRPTGLAIEEMLRSVRPSGEILLVGYTVSVAEGTRMERIMALLAAAARRHAMITVILHRDEDLANREQLLRAWDVFAKKPTILTWDPPPNHPYTKLHAKVLVVDRAEALVGSANFTFHGLESNLELGLRVRGPQAAAIAERFDHLIGLGVFRVWD